MLLKGKQDISFLVQQITAWDFGIVKLPQHYPNMKQKLPWGHVASPIVVRRLWWQQTDRWVMIVSLCCMILEKVRTVSAKWITACPWFKIPVIFTWLYACLFANFYFILGKGIFVSLSEKLCVEWPLTRTHNIIFLLNFTFPHELYS